MTARKITILTGFLLVVSADFTNFHHAVAQPIGNAEDGLEIANMLCADCHAVRKFEATPFGAEAPSFMSVARKGSATPLAIRAFLTTSHKKMPNLILDDRQIDNLAAYFQTLR